MSFRSGGVGKAGTLKGAFQKDLQKKGQEHYQETWHGKKEKRATKMSSTQQRELTKIYDSKRQERSSVHFGAGTVSGDKEHCLMKESLNLPRIHNQS